MMQRSVRAAVVRECGVLSCEEAINCEGGSLAGPSPGPSPAAEFIPAHSRDRCFFPTAAKDTAGIPDSSSKNQKAEATQ